MATLPDGRFFTVCGYAGPKGIGSVQVYDPAANNWDTTSFPAMPIAQGGEFLSATLGPDGVVYVLAVIGSAPTVVFEGYSLDAGSWAPYPAPAAGTDEAVTGLDGRLYFLGGGGQGSPHYVEIFNPADGGWTAPDNSIYQHQGPAAALGWDGTIYLAGGYGRQPCQDCAESLSPGAAVWTQLPAMPLPTGADYCGEYPGMQGDMNCGGALGADGRFYVLGGWIGFSGPIEAAVVAFAPDGGQWSNVGSMTTPRVRLRVGLGSGPDGQQYLFAIGGQLGTYAPQDCMPPYPDAGWPPSYDVPTVEAYKFW